MDTLRMYERLVHAGISGDLADAIVDMFRLAPFRRGNAAVAREWDLQMRSRLVAAGATYEMADAIVEVHRMTL